MKWDYNDITGDTWNIKSMKQQKKLLLRYYPIGMEVEFNPIENILDITIDMSLYWKIVNHVVVSLGHKLPNTFDKIYNITIDNGTEQKTLHPGFLRPTKKYMRTKKLERLI